MGGTADVLWQREPVVRVQPWRHARLARWTIAVVASVIVVAVILVGVREAVHQKDERDFLDRNGTPGSARVVNAYEQAGDGDGAVHFVTLHIDACECDVTKEVATLEGHPVGSRMPMRFDRTNPRRVEVLQDQTSAIFDDWPPALMLSALVVAALGVWMGVRWHRHRRATKIKHAVALGLQGRYRFDLWRHDYGEDAELRVALYDPADTPRSWAIHWIPVSSKRGLDDRELVEVWGDLGNPFAPLALRAGDGWLVAKTPHIRLSRPLEGPTALAPAPRTERALAQQQMETSRPAHRSSEQTASPWTSGAAFCAGGLNRDNSADRRNGTGRASPPVVQ